MWCLAFLIPWWPWSSEPGSLLVGAHFCVSICMFDSFLTYVRAMRVAWRTVVWFGLVWFAMERIEYGVRNVVL